MHVWSRCNENLGGRGHVGGGDGITGVAQLAARMPVGHLLVATTTRVARMDTRAAATGLTQDGVKRRRQHCQGSRSGSDPAGNS